MTQRWYTACSHWLTLVQCWADANDAGPTLNSHQNVEVSRVCKRTVSMHAPWHTFKHSHGKVQSRIVFGDDEHIGHLNNDICLLSYMSQLRYEQVKWLFTRLAGAGREWDMTRYHSVDNPWDYFNRSIISYSLLTTPQTIEIKEVFFNCKS